MTSDQAQRLLSALQADPELSRLMAAKAPACPRDATLAACGVPVTLAGREVSPPTADCMVALDLLRSPLLTGAESLTALDCWRALLAVTRGTAALSPLVGLDGALTEVARVAVVLGTDADKAVGKVAQASWAEVDRAALALAEKYPGATAQQVADVILAQLSAVREAWACVPTSGTSSGESRLDGDWLGRVAAMAAAAGLDAWAAVKRMPMAVLGPVIAGWVAMRAEHPPERADHQTDARIREITDRITREVTDGTC